MRRYQVMNGTLAVDSISPICVTALPVLFIVM